MTAMRLDSFGRQRFETTPENKLAELCRQLAELIAHKLASAVDWEAAAYAVVADLQAVGHDLWSFDESPTAQCWCGSARPSGELRLRFALPLEVEVTWHRWSDDSDPISATVGEQE
jgi:hypothetical protein